MRRKYLSIVIVSLCCSQYIFAQNFFSTGNLLQLGSRGQYVQNLQTFLNNYFNPGLKVDGRFGPQTQKAVQEFQRNIGLTPDGKVGPKTSEQIDKAKGPTESPIANNPKQEQQNQTQEGGESPTASQENSLDMNKLRETNPEVGANFTQPSNGGSSTSGGGSDSGSGSGSGGESMQPDYSNANSVFQDQLKDKITNGNQSQDQSSNNSAGEKGQDPKLIGMGIATMFNHADSKQKCKRDAGDQQFGGRSASGIKLGEVGKPGIPAVALPASVRKKNGVSFGTAVEVLNVANGACKSFPLLDAGPGARPLSKGVVIDLTGSAYDAINGGDPNGKACPKIPETLGTFSGRLKVKYYVSATGQKLSPGQVGECKSLK